MKKSDYRKINREVMTDNKLQYETFALSDPAYVTNSPFSK